MRKMKDSGIEWIGEIPEHWNVTTIGMLFNAKAGGDAKPDLYSDEKDEKHPYPVYTNTMDKEQVYAYTSSPVFEGNTITVTGRGDIGRAFYRTTPYDAIIRLLSLSPRTELSCPFYTYWINVVPFFTDNAAVGQLSAAQIKSYKSISIPLPEQQKISAHLDNQCALIDSVIEKTKASIEEYKKLRQAVITQAVTKGVRGDRPMKDSGIEWIGDIPQEWEVSKLKFYISLIESGTSVNAGQEAVSDGQIGVLKTSSVSKQVFNANENKNVNLEEYSRVSCPVKANTIIVSRMNTPELVGACGYVDKDYPHIFLPDRLWQVHFKNDVFVKYIYYWLISNGIRYYYSSLAVGTSSSMQNISQDQFYNSYWMIPSLEEQKEITAYLDKKCSEIDNIITKKETFLTELDKYK